jgi:hypothetical protein
LLTFYWLTFQDLEYEEFDLSLLMNDDEVRFGFSVIGGYDEGIAPRVDDVSPGENRLKFAIRCKRCTCTHIIIIN